MSNFKEKTKVQHYLSQVEQRLNAIDPTKPIKTQSDLNIFNYTIFHKFDDKDKYYCLLNTF